MANEYVIVRLDISRSQEVRDVSRDSGVNRFEVVGRLIELWSWATQQTQDGFLPRTTLAELVDILRCGDEQFWKCVCEAGWLREVSYTASDGRETRGLLIPNYDRWMSKNSKTRGVEAERKRKYRESRRASKASDTPEPDSPEADVRDKNGTMSQKCPGQKRDNVPEMSRTKMGQMSGTFLGHVRATVQYSTKQNKTAAAAQQPRIAAAAGLEISDEPEKTPYIAITVDDLPRSIETARRWIAVGESYSAVGSPQTLAQWISWGVWLRGRKNIDSIGGFVQSAVASGTWKKDITKASWATASERFSGLVAERFPPPTKPEPAQAPSLESPPRKAREPTPEDAARLKAFRDEVDRRVRAKRVNKESESKGET